MRKIEDIQKKLQMHPLWQHEIPIGFQMGFPMLGIRQRRLCLTYFAHRMQRTDHSIKMSLPHYSITWVHPFENVIAFSDLSYDGHRCDQEPMVEILMTDENIALYNGIYSQCETAVDEWEKEQKEQIIEQYQLFLDAMVRKLGVNGLYGRGE